MAFINEIDDVLKVTGRMRRDANHIDQYISDAADAHYNGNNVAARALLEEAIDKLTEARNRLTRVKLS